MSTAAARFLAALAAVLTLLFLAHDGAQQIDAGEDYEVIEIPSGGARPSAVVVDEATGLTYVLNAFDGIVSVFDGDQLVATLNLPCVGDNDRIAGFDEDCIYQGMALLPGDPPLVVIADFNSAEVLATVIELEAAGAVAPAGPPQVTVIPVGNGPTGIGADLPTNQMYVANQTDGTVSVIAIDTLTVTETIDVGGGPHSVEVDSVNGVAYVSNISMDVVHAIDTATNTEIDTIAAGNGPTGMALDQANSSLYVTNFIDSTVTVLELVVPGPAVAYSPTTIDVGPDTRPLDISLNEFTDRLFTADSFSDTSTVIDRNTRSVITAVDVGLDPDAVAANGQKGLIYVANHTTNSLSLISDPNPYTQRRWADVNCDGVVNLADMVATLREVGGLPPGADNDCPGIGQPVGLFSSGTALWGDNDCGGGIGGGDPLLVLRFFGGISLPDPKPGCPDVNEPVYVLDG